MRGKFYKKSLLQNILKKIIVFVITILTLILIDYSFYKPSKINEFLAANISSSPVNSAFVDENFYKCVVDAYNEENNSNQAYTESLTNEQLKSISELNCSGFSKRDDELIKDVAGLNLLTNLKKLDLSCNKIKSIDISHNTELEYLDLSDYYSQNNMEISSIFFENNNKLKYLNVSISGLTDLNLSALNELEGFRIDSNSIKSLNFSGNLNLEYLYIRSSSLSSLDVTSNEVLNTLIVDSNSIKQINLSTNIEALSLRNISVLETLDLSNLILLNQLEISGAKRNVDFSKSINLEYISITDSIMNSLDFSTNKLLSVVDIYRNNINGDVNLAKNINLKQMFFMNNTIEKTILPSDKLVNIRLQDDGVVSGKYDSNLILGNKYTMQSDEKISAIIENFETNGLKVEFYNDDEQILDGFLSLANLIKVYFDDGTYQILSVELFDNEYFEDKNFYQCVVDSYNIENDKSISYSEGLTYEQLESIETLNCSGKNKTQNNKIYSLEGINYLTNLKTLNVDNNIINTIGIYNNTKLEKINLIGNQFDTKFNSLFNLLNLYINESIANFDYTNEYSLGTTIKDLLPKLYDVSITDSLNNIKTSGYLGTGNNLEISIGGVPYVSSKIFVKGDVTGDGKGTVADVSKLYQHLKKKITMENLYIQAGNVVSDDNEIKVNDVSKLYQYIKGKINNL